MKKRLLATFGTIVLMVAILLVAVGAGNGGYVHGIAINVDGDDYYFDGPADGPGGEKDIPGHTWKQVGANELSGRHYNTGPFDAAQWWTYGAKDGQLLYTVNAIIDTWDPDKARRYASQGYIHYHELVKVSDGTPHPTKVVWLKHRARKSFYLDGGPHPELAHYVRNGQIDYEFIPNWRMAYP